MRPFAACIVVALLGPAASAPPDEEQVRNHFKSDDYTVTWGNVAAYDANSELEIGDGNGHGGTLGWLRFRPGREAVDVLSIDFDKAWKLQHSTWPEDSVPVQVKRARMNPDAYAALLKALAVVDSAQLRPVERKLGIPFKSSSNNAWVYARVSTGNETRLDLNWSGYPSTEEEVPRAKPLAAVALARAAVNGLDFAEHAPTDEDRGWASAKFARDLKKFAEIENSKGNELSHWWVRDRYVMTIGVVGDASALPTLREILVNAPAERHKHDFAGIDMSHSADRLVYYAINAITRLTKKDVRPRPVEEMDVEPTRRKVLDLLPEGK